MGSRRRGNNGWGEEGGRAVRVPLLQGIGPRIREDTGGVGDVVGVKL